MRNFEKKIIKFLESKERVRPIQSKPTDSESCSKFRYAIATAYIGPSVRPLEFNNSQAEVTS